MHVAIDRDNMGFLWAHQDYDVLLNMAHLEADCAVHVVSLENPAYYQPFIGFTDYELKLLYENTTGEKYEGFSRPALEQTIYGLAVRILPLEVNRLHLSFQAQQVGEEYSGLYKYVPGAKEPALIQDGLFGVPHKRLGRNVEAERLAALGELYPQLAPPARAFGGTGPDRPPASTNPAPRAPRPANSAPPPRGSTRETIWNCADKMWEDAGKPTSTSAVLALRKQIMNKLEEEGVKRTSSSNELGNWQKARLAQQTI
jgi:hypothetical protein